MEPHPLCVGNNSIHHLAYRILDLGFMKCPYGRSPCIYPSSERRTYALFLLGAKLWNVSECAYALSIRLPHTTQLDATTRVYS